MAKNVLKSPSRAINIAAINARAAASRNPKNVTKSLPELKVFYNTCKRLYLGKFVRNILKKWNKKQVDYTPQHH